LHGSNLDHAGQAGCDAGERGDDHRHTTDGQAGHAGGARVAADDSGGEAEGGAAHQ
jgi:hypothetical protein